MLKTKYPIGQILTSAKKVEEHLLDHDNVVLSISGGGIVM